MKTAFSCDPSHHEHAAAGHPERPERLDAVLDVLRADDVWERLDHREAAPADLDAVRLVHTDDYVKRLERVVRSGGGMLDADTYATPASLDVAREALGGLLAVTEAVFEGEADNAFAAIRPPGHHARPDAAMGFCLFANVAVAARWARRQYGVERLLIVDFDVHHGNGTQEVFYEDPNVLYMSTHQYPFYPGTGAADETGAGRGRGATVNVPLPAGAGDDALLAAFRRILAPLAARFRPECLFVSAGYDAHWKDPLGGLNVSTSGFDAIVYELLTWADAFCGNRLVCALEGGYDPEALAHSVRAGVRRLADPEAATDDPFGPAPGRPADVSRLITDLAAFHGV